MKRIPKRAVALAAALVFAALIHFGAARVLVEHDVVEAALLRSDPVLVAVAIVLVIARLFAFLFAPGWLLWVGVSLVLWGRARRNASQK
jgi:hypothetical protein